MALEQKITTGATFTQDGVLVPAGTVITVDMAKLGEKARTKSEAASADKNNLKDVDSSYKPTVAVIAPIAPTGPNPTAPQQLPPGTVQSAAGFTSEGALLVPEGGEAAAEFEEEAPQRTSSFDHDGDGNDGGSKPADPPALSGMNKADLLAVAKDEGVEVADGATNAEITAAIEAKRG